MADEVVRILGEFAASLPDDAKTEKQAKKTWVAWAKTSASEARRDAIIKGAQPYLAAHIQGFDRDPNVLNTASGVSSLRDQDLEPRSPAAMLSKITGAAWDTAADPAIWKEFIEKILPDREVREFLQRY